MQPEGAKTVLVVDDEVLIGMEIETILLEAGYRIAGPTVTVAETMQLLDGELPDAAVLDLNLRGQRSDTVADRLVELGIPFVYLTGHAESVIAERHRQVPRIDKPFTSPSVLAVVSAVFARND